MRAGAIISVAVFVLATCLLRSSEAVTCTADATVAGCTDCTHAANAADAECVAEAAAHNTPYTSYDYDFTTTAKPPSSHWGQSSFPWHKVKNMLLMF